MNFNNGFGPENSCIEHAFKIADAAEPPTAKRGRQLVVCKADEILPGERRIVEDEKISIGVYNIKGQFYAIKNVCPHAGAPLCQGHIQTTHRPGEVGEFEPTLEGRVLRCPWHGWEFDIITGKGLYDRNSRVATYPVEVSAEGYIVVTL
jgi:nitrite reductase (NADH) small subunit